MFYFGWFESSCSSTNIVGKGHFSKVSAIFGDLGCFEGRYVRRIKLLVSLLSFLGTSIQILKKSVKLTEN